MPPEVLTQLLDTAALILITPELAGEERLARLRSRLPNWIKVLRKVQPNPGPSPLGDFFFAGIIRFFIIIIWLSVYVAFEKTAERLLIHAQTKSTTEAWLAHVLATAVPLLIALWYFRIF